MTEITVPWGVLVRKLRAGTLVPFLGAGASSFAWEQDGGAPPTANALGKKLAEDAGVSVSCDHGEHGCAMARFDLAKLASYYQKVGSRPLLDEFLQQEIAAPAFKPNKLHRLLALIARTKPMLIITTNYDNLLEQAFEEASVPFEVIATPAVDTGDYDDANEYEAGTDTADLAEIQSEAAGAILHWVSGASEADFRSIDPQTFVADLSKRSIIYKIHGSVPRNENGKKCGYLIAEEDYVRFLGRMGRVNIVPDHIMKLLQKKEKKQDGRGLLPAYSFLFLGYSLQDWNLRVLLEELRIGRSPVAGEIHYAIMRNPQEMECKLLNAGRRIEVFDCDLGQFAEKVSDMFPPDKPSDRLPIGKIPDLLAAEQNSALLPASAV